MTTKLTLRTACPSAIFPATNLAQTGTGYNPTYCVSTSTYGFGYYLAGNNILFLNFFVALRPKEGHGCPVFELLRSYTNIDAPQSVGLLWSSDQLVAKTSLYLTTHNTHKRQTSILPAGFEPSIPASQRLKTYALYRAATGNGILMINEIHKYTVWTN